MRIVQKKRRAEGICNQVLLEGTQRERMIVLLQLSLSAALYSHIFEHLFIYCMCFKVQYTLAELGTSHALKEHKPIGRQQM